MDPFPEVENVGEEKGHWEKATRENCQKGARVRVVAAKHTVGAYQNGDQGILQGTPPAPSFRVGDIVRLREGKNVFAPKLKGKVGKVYEVLENPEPWVANYSIVLNVGSGAPTLQYCSERSGQPAPLELVYREPEKGGEKA